jgi:hypothetical protein
VPQAQIDGIQNAEQKASRFMLKGMEARNLPHTAKKYVPSESFRLLSAHIF